jgi:WS/DGAT/MGAT family acyltransferase
MYLAVETPTTPMHFGVLAILDGATLRDARGRLRLGEIRHQLAERVEALPELRSVLYRPGWPAGGPLWIDARDFRIERHVDGVAMPTRPSDEAALLDFVEDIMAPLLDRADPLWHLWLITGLTGGRVAALFVIHHALADGATAMRLLRVLLTDRAPRSADGRAGPSPTTTDLLIDNARGYLLALRDALRPSMWPQVSAATRTLVDGWKTVRHEPPTSLNAVVGRRRRTAVMRFDLATAKRLARSRDVGVNDLVLELLAGGVRALLASRAEPIGQLAPRVGIAVGLPPSHRDGDGGNAFGSYVVALPIGEPDPTTRLHRIARERMRAAATRPVTGITTIRAWSARFPPARMRMGRQRFVNLMETYMPGPPARIKVLGAPVLDAVPVPPLGRNVGLAVVASSYAGRLSLTVRTDPDAFPDLDVLLAAMATGWRALSGAAGQPTPTVEDDAADTQPVAATGWTESATRWAHSPTASKSRQSPLGTQRSKMPPISALTRPPNVR